MSSTHENSDAVEGWVFCFFAAAIIAAGLWIFTQEFYGRQKELAVSIDEEIAQYDAYLETRGMPPLNERERCILRATREGADPSSTCN